MKFRLSATISICVLLTVVFCTLCSHGSQEIKENSLTEPDLQQYNSHNCENRGKVFEQKWKTFSRLMLEKYKLQKNTFTQNFLQPSTNTYVFDKKESAQIDIILESSNSKKLQQTIHLSQNSLLLASKKNILFMIVHQFLTIKDILVLRESCKAFQNLIQRNHAKMVTFYNYGDSKKTIDTSIIWEDLKYFLKQSYYSAFYEIKMFNTKENHYAILTRGLAEEKIIVWKNNLTPYPQILLHRATTQNTPAFASHQQNSYSCNQIETWNTHRTAWAKITREGNVKTGGSKQEGGNSSIVQSQLKNVKLIVSNFSAFAALLIDGHVVTWGNENTGGKISKKIQIQLYQNVKMLVSTFHAFAALLNNGSVVAWGAENSGGTIPEKIQTQLHQNVKNIFSGEYAFAVLLNNGNVLAWGDSRYGGKIPDEMQIQLRHQNVKTLVSGSSAFTALLNDGSVLSWGWPSNGGEIPDEIQIQLFQNFKIIVSTKYAFAVLLKDGSVLAWGNDNYGGKIPDEIQIQLFQNVKMIFSSKNEFAALLNDGSVLVWGFPYEMINFAGPARKKLIKNDVKMIFSTDEAFAALLNDGSLFIFGDQVFGGKKYIESKLIKNVKIIFPYARQFTALCKNGEIVTWPEDN